MTQEDIDTGNYITDGLVPQAGDIKYVDLDGDGKLTDKDRTYIGCDVPDITYGVNLNLRYKGFELSMFGQGSYRYKGKLQYGKCLGILGLCKSA